MQETANYIRWVVLALLAMTPFVILLWDYFDPDDREWKMICQYTTFCEFCSEEEEFISTSSEPTCGKCGKKSNIVSQTPIVQEKHENPKDS